MFVVFFNFAASSILRKKIEAKFVTFDNSWQNSRSSDICVVLMF